MCRINYFWQQAIQELFKTYASAVSVVYFGLDTSSGRQLWFLRADASNVLYLNGLCRLFKHQTQISTVRHMTEVFVKFLSDEVTKSDISSPYKELGPELMNIAYIHALQLICILDCAAIHFLGRWQWGRAAFKKAVIHSAEDLKMMNFFPFKKINT